MAKNSKPLSYKARRRWSLVVLLIGLPLYIILCATIMSTLPRLPIAVELLVYVIMGVAWALPLKFVFSGIGKEDPDQ